MVLLNHEDVISKLRSSDSRKVETNVWYLDNGASNHKTREQSKFKELDDGITGQVRFGDGSTLNIKERCTISFKCKNGKERDLNEVYFIPTLSNNIISLGQLSEDGNKVVLSGEYLWVYDTNGKLLMKVKKSPNRLYKIIIEESGAECLLTKTEVITKSWHSRLRHVNYQAMLLMSNRRMAHGLPTFTQPKEICKGCLVSKQARKPFPSQSCFTGVIF